MRYSQKTFDRAVWETVSAIRPGYVMSYGDVARAAGFPRHARMVSKAMSRSSVPLPWHRVVKSDGTLAFSPGSEAYNRQKALLEQDGVALHKGKVAAIRRDAAADLDRLIWGPTGT